MSEDPERTPLLTPKGKGKAEDDSLLSETAPLLSGSSGTPRYDGENDDPDRASFTCDVCRSPRPPSAASSRTSSSKSATPWASIISIVVLATLAVCIMLVGFFVPAAVEEYAKQAAVVEPTNLALESITTNGVRARVQANFRLDGSRVPNPTSRRIGKFTTWIVRKLGTDQTKVGVYLPDYDGALLGTAVVPPLTISIVDGETTKVDFVAELSPGDAEAYRKVANEWLDGKLGELKVLGKADIPLKSGILPLGTHPVSEVLVFEANQIPTLPTYNISRLNFRDVPDSDGERTAVGADVAITAFNEFPISLDVPELGFQVLVPNCNAFDPYILVADATTAPVTIEPRTEVTVNVSGIIRELPKDLTRVCPNSKSSPLDKFLEQYMHGEAATVYVRGRKVPGSDTPSWVGDILSEIMVPVPFPGQGFDNLIKSFSLTDVNFELPDPMADPDEDDGNPKVSGTVQVLAGLPKEMNFDINVTNMRATADVMYQHKKLGELNLEKWQPANSTKIEGTEKKEPLLKITSRVVDAPLNITDGDVLTDVMQKLIFGGKEVLLDVKAAVDIKVNTALGNLVLKDIPAEGKIPVKPLPGNAFGSARPQVGDVKIISSTSTSLTLEALVNITNPTPYAAFVPYVNIHIVKDGVVLGSATAENMNVVRGNNTNLLVTAKWDPTADGEAGRRIAGDLISEYLSGRNVTIGVKTHRGTLPSVPAIGEALSKLNISIAAPKLDLPGDGDGEKKHFIRDATFHVFSSTATFTLASPLTYNTIYVDWVNATAFYNHTESVGRIVYDLPFAAPPGTSTTPRLPVDWHIGSVGYDAVRKAIGGALQLDAMANVTVRIGNWKETIWYEGQGIGASIRL
ncbi:pre-rRNA processing protein [Colletotrichum sojae]|uniref:Pre-rRNA processing protein n=1 Tax=Colletotrichum sojae TaxID=2175907 RepID=A0A8H6N1G8_9PEZI|nr:pre-rRNA processing protein [Colletotrichum sojae]